MEGVLERTDTLQHVHHGGRPSPAPLGHYVHFGCHRRYDGGQDNGFRVNIKGLLSLGCSLLFITANPVLLASTARA